MEGIEWLKTEIGKLDDLIYTAEGKIHSLVGLLEVVSLGIQHLDKVEDSYELCCMNLIMEYLKAMETSDMKRMHSKVNELREICEMEPLEKR